MDPNTFPTKGNLILAKNSLALSRQGYELMDKKRNILIREMMELIDQAKEELLWLLDASKDMDMLTFIGLPWMKDGKLYNVAAVIKSG